MPPTNHSITPSAYIQPASLEAGSSAEQQAAAFASDERIHFDRTSGTWRFEDEEGHEFEYDSVKGKWSALLDDDLVRAQQAAYSIAGVDESTPAAPVLKRESKKRKAPEDYTSNTVPADAGPSQKRNKKLEERKSKNTAVYVTNLPLDATHDELVSTFSKCGLIEEDDNGEPKVKLYAKADGSFSGEALVVYFKEESVGLALNIMDESELRLGDGGTVMKVQKAQFGHKHEEGGNKERGEVKRKVVDKKAASRRIGKMQKKIGEWDADDGFGPAITEEDKAPVENKNGRVVVLKHMFTLHDLETDKSLLLDLKEDVRDEASTLGEVTNVVLYDKEPEGIMTVKFRDPLSAQACVLKMNGRFFDGRRVDAFLYSGKQRYKRSGQSDEIEGDSDEAEKKRLDDFAQWLLTEGD
ncbi:hypothetical protein QCA50_004266 [Cerrena zonata]|uniref:RRM domain-containing protein n=1 Tax=Cerrena zonata TaxID=2478898 RepID=A0AAW0GGR7_9APHY